MTKYDKIYPKSIKKNHKYTIIHTQKIPAFPELLPKRILNSDNGLNLQQNTVRTV